MAVKKKGLGPKSNDLALSELLSDFKTDAPGSEGTYAQLSLTQLQTGRYQPRQDMDFETIQQLADSIAARGIVQPLVVRPLKDTADQYEIIAGHRRCQAAKQAGLTEIPVIIRDIEDEAALAMSFIENVQREDLNAIDKAKALKRLTEEFGLKQEEVASGVGLSRAGISNLIRLLNLAQPVQTLLEHGDLEMGHARALLSLPEASQNVIAEKVIAQGLSVRQTEALVKDIQDGHSGHNTSSRPAIDPDVLRLQEQISNRLSVKVKIKHQTKGNGRIEVHYKDIEELDRILELIQSSY